MEYQTIENQPLNINFNELLNDRGWVLGGTTATHFPCNSNTKLKLVSHTLEAGASYLVTFTIKTINGTLGVGLNSAAVNYGTSGLKTVTLVPTSANDKVTFWGTGYLVIEVINIVKAASEIAPKSEHTVTWGENRNRWITFKGYRPELGFSMFNDLFTLKNGELHIHKQTTNSYNVFYGKSFDTYVKFPMSSVGIKTYQSIAIHANRIIGTSVDGIKTSLGHVSDLLEVDFTEKEGIFYADFLRDKLTDIVNGDRLKGRYIVLELQAKGQNKLQLFKVVAKSAQSTANE